MEDWEERMKATKADISDLKDKVNQIHGHKD